MMVSKTLINTVAISNLTTHVLISLIVWTRWLSRAIFLHTKMFFGAEQELR
jgi:hypothetical protein